MAKKETGQAMGTGGGGMFGRKTELVADLTTAFKELNKELEKTRSLSAEISKNLKSAKPGGGANNLLAGSMGDSTGTKTAAENDGSQTGGGGIGLGGIFKGIFATAGKMGLAGLQGLPTVQQAFEQDLLRARFGFYGGSGANATQMRMSRMGTSTDPLDAARASMTGASYGLMAGLRNFSTIERSAAGISNLMPGVGLQGGMQATGMLNQANNVNMLRMIGVNVRDAQGLMRGFDEIAGDLWKVLNRGKSSEGKITKEQLSFSLQPGNALDSMLNQYFGNDPILRQTIVSKLMDMAGSGGPTSSLDKQRLASAGATTSAIESMSARNTASLNATQAVAPSVLAGFEKANELLATASNKVADIARDAGLAGDAFRKILESKGFLDTLGSSGNGAGAAMLGIGTTALGTALGYGRGLLKGARSAAGTVGTGVKTASKGLARFIPGLGLVVSAGSGFFDGRDDDGMSKSGILTSILAGAGAGAVAGAPVAGVGAIPGAVLGGLIGATTYTGGYTLGKKTSGQGGGEGAGASGYIMPFQGSYPITSAFGSVRHLVFDGQKSPSYGREHGGIDYGLPEGTPVFASADGTIQATPYDAPGFGNYIKLVTDDGTELFYGHLNSKNAPGGARVKAGDLVGYSGNSGKSTGPHLHFEVRKSGSKMDPSAWLAGAGNPSLNEGSIPQPIRADLTMSNPFGHILNAGGPGITSATDFSSMTNSGHGSATINYGGVNITFNMPEKTAADPKEIAREVKNILSSSNIREKAVSK